MKRYMIVRENFDTRPNILNLEIQNSWEEKIKEMWRGIKESIFKDLLLQYGLLNRDKKIQNFRDVGVEPMSVISHHNSFFRECKSSFIMCDYYPALTGACALGERILNHLVLKLRDYYKTSKIYKKIYDKESFDNWGLAIDALVEWGVLLEEVPDLFKQLHKIRNDSIHFNNDLEVDRRTPALEALKLVHMIIDEQFGSRPGGNRTWFIIEDAPGYSFIKKECEDTPFIKEFYLPLAILVGPYHRFEKQENGNQHILDINEYEDKEISDQEFLKFLKEFRDQ